MRCWKCGHGFSGDRQAGRCTWEDSICRSPWRGRPTTPPVGFRRPRPPEHCWTLAFTGRIRRALSWDVPFPGCMRKCIPTIPSASTRKRGGKSWCAATTPPPSWWSSPTAPPAALCSPNVCWGTRTICVLSSAGMKRSLRGTWSNATGSGWASGSGATRAST